MTDEEMQALKAKAEDHKQRGWPFVPVDVSAVASLIARCEAAEARADLTWFWSIVDRDGLNGVPSDERDALARLVASAASCDALAAENARLREALNEIVRHCNNQGYGNPVVDNRTVDRCEETAMEALAAGAQT